MQNRRGDGNSGAINENFHKSNGRKYPSNEHFDSSKEYEEETQETISYQLRRWANHIWSVSNNVTSRLRQLLGNNSSSNTTSNHSVGGSSCQDESRATSWTTSSDIIESSNRINVEDCIRRSPHHQQSKNHWKSTSRENWYRYGQKFSHATEGHRMHQMTVNRVETNPNSSMGHGVAAYPPILRLPRIHQGVNQQPMHTGFYQSRQQMLRHDNMHGDQYADGWYQHYHRVGKQWGSDGCRSRNNYSNLSERHQIPEKLSSLMNGPKIESFRKKTTRTSRRGRKNEPGDYDFNSLERLNTHVHDFHCDGYKDSHKTVSQIHNTRRSPDEIFPRSRIPRNYQRYEPRQNSDNSFRSSARSNARRVVWDLQLSDITSQEPSSTNPSRVALSTKSSVTLNIEKKRISVDQNIVNVKSTLKSYENVEVPVKDNDKQQEITAPPVYDVNIVRGSEIAHDTQQASLCSAVGENKDFEKPNDGLANGNGIKWSSVTKNSVDSLLQSLRERMDTLANVHSLDTEAKPSSIECNRKKEASLTKECIVASCMTGTYLPSCLESRHSKMAAQFVTKNEEVRPSFSDRIQDIWRDGKSEVWRSSPRHEISSRYNLMSEKDVFSKLSLLGLNQQPVLREYFGEYNNAVTLARILEKLIDSKSKSDDTPTAVSEVPKPPPRFSRKPSETCVQVNVGVQKSTPTSFTPQEQASHPRYRLIEKQKSRRSLRRTIKPRNSELPIETPRPLQVFSGQSIIPISSVQFAPVPHLLQDKRSSFNCCSDPSDRYGRSMIIDNPVVQELNPASIVDTSLKYSPILGSNCKDYRESSFASNRGSSSFTRELAFAVKDASSASRDIESSKEEEMGKQIINEQEHILSLVLEKIQHEQQRAQPIVQNTGVSKQHAQYHSATIRLQESGVTKDRVENSGKGCSWWSKKFHFNKNSKLKRKMASLLKYVTKKHSGDNNNSQKYAFDKDLTEIIVPIPPVRMRRKCTAGGTRSSKSIQWELDPNLPSPVKKIDSSQVTENQQSHKSTSVSSIARRVTVTSGTNTNPKKSHKANSKLSPIQNKEELVAPETIKVSKKACSDSSNKLLTCDRTSIGLDIVADVENISEFLSTKDKSSFNDPLLPSEENFESPNDHCQKEHRDLSKLKKFKISRSSSSKIPLATKLMSPLNNSSIVCEKRPSTAPMLDKSPSNSSRSNLFLEEFEAGKLFSKEFVSQEAAKKMRFKHNRSSLLRANNSLSKRSAIGQCIVTKKIMGDIDVERKSISKALELFVANETQCIKLVSENQMNDGNSDTKTKNLSLAGAQMNDSSETPSIFSTSVYRTKQTLSAEITSVDPPEVSLPKKTDLRENKLIKNHSVPPLKLQLIDSNNSSKKKAQNLSRNSKGTCRNLKYAKDKQRSPKATTTFPLDVNLCSPRTTNEKETPMENLKSQKLGDNGSIVVSYTPSKGEKVSCKTRLTPLVKENNVKTEKDEVLPTELEIFEDPMPKSVDFVESNENCRTNLNVSKVESKKNSSLTENSMVYEQPEEFLTCRVEIDEMKPTLNNRAKFQPRLAHSTPGKTVKYLLKHPDVPVQKLVSQNKETCSPERSRKSCLQSKSIPSSRLSPRHGISKSSIKSSKLLYKKLNPSSVTVARFDSTNNESKVSLSRVCRRVDHPQSPIIKTSTKPDFVPVYKTARPILRVAKSKHNNSKHKLVKFCRKGNENTGETLELVRKVLDVAISESINVQQKTNLEMVSSKQNTRQRIYSNSEISSDLSIDSLESIRVQVMSRTPAKETDEKYSPSLPLNQEKVFENSCLQKQPGMWLKKAQSPTNELKITSGTIGNERHNGYRGIQLSEKFCMASKSLPRNKANEISTLLNTKGAKVVKDEGKFAIQRSQIPRHHRSDTTSRDNKLKVTTMPPNSVNYQNQEEVISVESLEMEHYLKQSIITLDLAEIADKPEKLRPSMFDVQFEDSVEFSKFKLRGIYSKKFENRRLSNSDSNSKVMDDKNSGKSSKGSINVKIDNKVLEEKVMCSMQNGVPLKRITITDPSIIRHDCLNYKNLMTDTNLSDKSMTKMRSEVQHKLTRKLVNNSQDHLSDDKSEGQCSHTTWASHENRDIDVKDKTVLKIQSKSDNVEFHTVEELANVIEKNTRAIDEDNSFRSITSLQLRKKPTRPGSTLIPRYKKMGLVSSTLVKRTHTKNHKIR